LSSRSSDLNHTEPFLLFDYHTTQDSAQGQVLRDAVSFGIWPAIYRYLWRLTPNVGEETPAIKIQIKSNSGFIPNAVVMEQERREDCYIMYCITYYPCYPHIIFDRRMIFLIFIYYAIINHKLRYR